jgi:formylglycine-generating enzyme required for sulfatase activity
MKLGTFFIIIVILVLNGCSESSAEEIQIPSIETGVNPNLWVTIPKGPFLLGQHETQSSVDYDYAMMVTDVTNEQYATFLNAAITAGYAKVQDQSIKGTYPGDEFHGHRHEVEIKTGDWLFIPINEPMLRLTYDGTIFTPKSGFENHPMTVVSWFGAWGYCRFYSWRLPLDIEWEKAARGVDNRPYPWGHNIQPANANYISSHDILDRIYSGAGGTTPVGFYNGLTYLGFKTLDSPSPYGLYDMAGNVWQWTGDIQKGAHYRNLRGGSYTNYAYNLRIWTHNNADPSHYSPSVGFRCVKDL